MQFSVMQDINHTILKTKAILSQNGKKRIRERKEDKERLREVIKPKPIIKGNTVAIEILRVGNTLVQYLKYGQETGIDKDTAADTSTDTVTDPQRSINPQPQTESEIRPIDIWESKFT